MAIFITRIELHDAVSSDYERLHQLMAQRNFQRTIGGEGGRAFLLPTGTYMSESDAMDANAVRDIAQQVAASVGKKYWIITTMGQSAWYLNYAS